MFLFCSRALAQYGESSSYRFAQERLDVEYRGKWKLHLGGGADFRFVGTGSARNWQKPDEDGVGGQGLTRYGGTARNAKSLSLRVPQLSLFTDVKYNQTHLVHLQFNFNDVEVSQAGDDRYGLVEGYYRNQWGYSNHRLAVRAGVMFPEISMEHGGSTWSTQYTLTPSAINTWVAEELRATAFELSYLYLGDNIELELAGAGFSGNDSSGAMLAWRGWAIHDYVPTLGSHLRVQEIPAAWSTTQTIKTADEIDGKMGVYTRLSMAFREKTKVVLFFSDNNGDAKRVDTLRVNNAWKNVFLSGSIKQMVIPGIEILGQYLSGSATEGRESASDVDVKVDFSAWYALLNFQSKFHSVSIRHDEFRVDDKDGLSIDNNQQSGRSQTLAYFYKISGFNTIGLEYVHLRNRRPGNTDEAEDPADDIFQWNYRLSF